jgi:hypothetical protein
VIPMLKKAGVPSRRTWTSGAFGEGFTFTYITPITSFAQFDGDGQLTKALGAEAVQAYAAKNRRFIEGTHTYASRTRPDLGVAAEKMTGPPTLGLLTLAKVVNGKNLEFEALLKSDVRNAMKKAGRAYYVSQVVYGGDIATYVTAVPYDTYEEIGKGHPFEVGLGPDGAAKLAMKAGPLLTSVERSIIRFNPDLSFMTPKGTN